MLSWPLQGPAIEACLTEVMALLSAHQHHWQLQPMSLATLPFSTELNTVLEGLSLSQLAELEQNPQRQQEVFAPFFPALFHLPLGWQAPVLPDLAEWPFWLTNGIGGRKLNQIQHFCQQLAPATLPLVEWCAGKGHLGRLLAAKGYQVTSIEWQPALCLAGTELAKRFALSQQFVCADVLSSQGNALLAPEQQVVALHACGELHLQLLRQVVAVGVKSVQLAPCCYHLIPQPVYLPLSDVAQQSALTLTREDLKLAVQGQVTAGERIARLRQTEVTWRLAFQILRRELTGQAHYQPLPSLPKHWFSGELPDFLAYAAAMQQLTLPQQLDYSALLTAAKQAYLLLKRIDAVRHLFRRPLELYLVLDRARYLQQHGYQVQLTILTDYPITPRNFLIKAQLGRS